MKRYRKWLTLIKVKGKTQKKHYPNWAQIPDYLYRILITEGFESGKIKSLFHLISQQPNIDNILFIR